MNPSLRAVDWALLHTFLAVLYKGSLIAAAASTGVSHPTLGRQIDALEAQLGVSLFERAAHASRAAHRAAGTPNGRCS